MSEQAICPIWGTPAEVVNGPGGASVRSLRAGGQYRISSTAQTTVANLTTDEKARLSTWIVDQHRFGDTNPFVKDEQVQWAKERRPLRFSEKVERFLLALAANNFRPGDKMAIGARMKGNDYSTILKAWLEMEDDELVGFAKLLADEGTLTPLSTVVFTLSARGFSRLEQMQIGSIESSQGFVAMWFGAEVDQAFTHGIEPALADAGYRAFRIDRKEHNNPIDDEIVAEIRRSRFLIADFTCPVFDVAGKAMPNPRGGVYYEAGFAQGLGIPVFWSCRADMIDHLHFDTRQMPHMTWTTPDELRQKVHNRVVAVLGAGPGSRER